MKEVGKIIKISKTITVKGSNISIGDITYIEGFGKSVVTEISDEFFTMRPFFSLSGLYINLPVYSKGEVFKITIGDNILGNVLDGFGNSIIGKNILGDEYEIYKKNKTILKEPTERLITGQRVIDSLFPIFKGESTAIPGGFGTGKTQLLHQIAKNSNVDIVVYVGIGERGNEIASLYENFTKLDIMKRTIIIATTSDEITSLREQSIYIGLTIAEFYAKNKDVLIIIDSLSRFAESMRELMDNEIPIEEGYPSYLESKLTDVLERSFAHEKGSLSIAASISPWGSEASDYVTSIVKNIVHNCLELDRKLASSRHFPAINYLKSYSHNHKKSVIIEILQKEEEILEIANLVGKEVLHDSMKLILTMASHIKKGFLKQSAGDETPFQFQKIFLNYIMLVHTLAESLIEEQIPIRILEDAGFFNGIYEIKENPEEFPLYKNKIKSIHNRIKDEYTDTLHK